MPLVERVLSLIRDMLVTAMHTMAVLHPKGNHAILVAYVVHKCHSWVRLLIVIIYLFIIYLLVTLRWLSG